MFRDRKAGKITDISPERLSRLLPSVIAGLIERLRIEEATKAGVIPVWPRPAAAADARPGEPPERAARS